MSNKSERLKNLNDSKLIDVVKNYRQYGYDEGLRNTAITILEERGIDKEFLQMTHNYKNRTYDFAQDYYMSYRRNSKIAFILYGLLIAHIFLSFFWAISFEAFTVLYIIIYISFLIAYIVFLIKSFIDYSQFYKAVDKSYGSEAIIVFCVLGLPFYVFTYFYFRNKMNEQMKMIQ